MTPSTNTPVPIPEPGAALLEQVILQGDLSRLSPGQRVQYYRAVCQSIGVNPLTKPFDYIVLNGKLTLYATRTCTDQIRAHSHLTITITNRAVIDDIYVVTARGELPDGRSDEATGAVNVLGLKGEEKANAWMKAETKAKRRLTLSLAGLGVLDESELDGTAAVPIPSNLTTGEMASPSSLGALKPEPKAQHPLVAAGLPTEAVKQIAEWIGQGRSVADWTADQMTAAQAVRESTLAALHAGINGSDLAEIIAAYADRGLADVAAYVQQVGVLAHEIPSLTD